MSIGSPVRIRKPSLAYRLTRISDSAVRCVYFAMGIVLTVVGVVAIALPIIPAVNTLLASTFFLNRSCPELQYWINNRPLVGRFFKYLDGTRPMTRATQVGFTVYLWGNLLISCACLYGIGLASYPIVTTNVLCCLLSTVFLLKFRAPAARVTKTFPAKQCAMAAKEDAESQTLAEIQGISQALTNAQAQVTAKCPSLGLPHSAQSTETTSVKS